MPEQSRAENARSAEEITITRIFDAPRELVFKAWTEPERFASWFGPADSDLPRSMVAMDVRPGGEWRATMFAGPSRKVIQWHGVYLELVPPERLVLTFSDRPGEEPVVATVILTDLGDGRTQMVFRQRGGAPPPDEYPPAEHGWSVFFDRMAEHLAMA
jgi:uncharacterized protein YndB with AHSA1/START domain